MSTGPHPPEVEWQNSPHVVYKITCLKTGKAYFGISRHGSAKRWRRHVRDSMRKGPVGALHGSIRKWGTESFAVTDVYVSIDCREARIVERAMIAAYGTLWPNGYNLTTGGETTPRVKCSEETREKMSASRKGKKQSAETIEKRMAHKRGIPRSAETKEKLRIAHTGKKLSDAHKLALSEAQKGRKISIETRKKLSFSLKGRIIGPHSKERREAIRVGNLKRLSMPGGRNVSPEARQKMSEASNKRWQAYRDATKC